MSEQAAKRNRTTRAAMLPSWATVLVVVAAAALGSLVTATPGLVFTIVLAVLLLPLVNARPSVWIGLALAIPWVSRLVTTTGLAPRVVDFLDFPLVLVAFVVAGLRFSATDRVLTRGQRGICWMVVAAALAILLSWAFNDYFEPLRLFAGLILALEPFLLLVAILLAPISGADRRNLLMLVLGLLAVQIPFSLASIAMGNIGDDVKGTLWETGAGHHVSAGSLALAFFLLAALRARASVLVAFSIAAIGIMIAADAKQVMFVLPLAVIALGMTISRDRSVASVVGGATAGVMMAGLVVYALLSYSASSTAIEFIDNSTSENSGKVAVVPVLIGDLARTPSSFVFGQGPGESVSRFAFLTTDGMIKAGSPVAVLGLHKSRNADRYDRLAIGGNPDKSSFTSAQSSIMGIIGDYGVIGLITFLSLIGSVFAGLFGCADRGLRSAALASWVLLLPLAVVFDWLEQPPFTLSVVVITGLALRSDAVMPPLPASLFRRQRGGLAPTSSPATDSIAAKGPAMRKDILAPPGAFGGRSDRAGGVEH